MLPASTSAATAARADRSSRSPSSLALAFGTLAAAVGYWEVIEAPELTRSPDDAAVIAAARTVPRGEILDRDGRVPGAQRGGRERRALPRLRGPRYQPGRRLRLAPVRAGRPRAGLRRRAGRPGRRPGRATRCASSGRPVRPAGPDAVPVARAAAGRGRGARRSTRRGGHARPAHRRGPGPGLDADLRRVGHHRPGDGRARRSRRCARTTGRAAPAARDARPVRARLGVQDRDRHRRPRLRRGQPDDDVRGAARRRGGRPASSTASASATATTRRPATRALDLIGATEASCNIWYALTGLETGGEALVEYAGRLGFGAPLPFDLPTAPSRR